MTLAVRVTLLAASLLGLAVAAARAEGEFVRVDRYALQPDQMTIAAGDTVTFQHEGSATLVDPTFPITLVAHRVGGGRTFESPPLEPGDSFAFRFDRPGLYRVRVDSQPDVDAEIVVE